MKCRTMFSLGAFAVLAGAVELQGQAESRPRTGSVASAPAKKPVRIGVAQSAPPAQPVVVNTTGVPTYVVPASTAPTRTPGIPMPIAQITYYPTLVLSNGWVVANFGTGRGYEPVLRQCPQGMESFPSGVQVAPCWAVDAYGNYRVMQRR